ncbi:MAG TPA: hypothetical protein PK859_14820 [Spirochaetota bacterium]|nr:hypothetical protein [Spirochaetota bacterium]HPR49658.1 hypothetical protein [Spirochaetota bacterium]
MKYGKASAQERLLYLACCLDKVNIKEVIESLSKLISDALNGNPEAVRHLNDLSLHFSNISLSYYNLADFIDRKYLTKDEQ